MLSDMVVPIIEETEGGASLAAFKVLDAFHLTAQSQCNLTEVGDGRHYKSMDLGLLKLVAQAALAGEVTRPETMTQKYADFVRDRTSRKRKQRNVLRSTIAAAAAAASVSKT